MISINAMQLALYKLMKRETEEIRVCQTFPYQNKFKIFLRKCFGCSLSSLSRTHCIRIWYFTFTFNGLKGKKHRNIIFIQIITNGKFFGPQCFNKKLFQILLAGFRKLLFDPGEGFGNACIDSRKIFVATRAPVGATPRYNTNQRFNSSIIVCQGS